MSTLVIQLINLLGYRGVGNPFADPKLVKTGPLSKVKATFILRLISIHLPLFKTRIVWEYFPEEIEKVFFSSNKTDWATFPLWIDANLVKHTQKHKIDIIFQEKVNTMICVSVIVDDFYNLSKCLTWKNTMEIDLSGHQISTRGRTTTGYSYIRNLGYI